MNRSSLMAVIVSGLLSVAMILSGTVRAQQTSSNDPIELAVVIQLLKDSGATELQEQRLLGKTYFGIVTIEDVRISPQDKAVVFVEADYGNDSKQYWKMRFEIPNDDRALQLKKGGQVRLSGTLTGFPVVKSIYIGGTPTRWAVLSNARIQ